MKCDMNCLGCMYEDCVNEDPGIDVEQYLEYVTWDGEYVGAPVEIKQPVIVPDEYVIEQMQGDVGLYSWCERKGVMPQVQADVEILRRAYEGRYSGKKLEKALYKVRHRKEYLAQKARWRERQRMKKRTLRVPGQSDGCTTHG